MRRCAYCGSAGPLTKEHIFPDFLIRESPGYRTFVDRARDERVHKSPPTIRDVCGRCNNGALSALDSYGRKLTRAHFARSNAPTFPVAMTLDYHPLSRWLLKLSYNASRSQSTLGTEYEALIPYILGDQGTPEVATTVLLGVLAPVPATPQEIARGLDAQWHPSVHTMGKLNVRAMADRVRLTTLATFNWYVFGVIVWKQGTARPARRRAVAAMEQCNGMVELKPGDSTVVVPTPLMDARTWAFMVMRGQGELTSLR